MTPCFACCLMQPQADGAPPPSVDFAFVMGVAHSVERGIIETTGSLCRTHKLALQTFADNYATARRRRVQESP